MKDNVHTFKEEFIGIVGFIAAIWIVYFLSFFLPVNDYGIQPRSLGGAIGIVTSPFLHANFGHIFSNTFPLFILLCLLAGSRVDTLAIVVSISLGTGLLLWIVGRDLNHVGASGLIFGLIAFLILSGFKERRPMALLAAFIALFFYGGTLIWGVLPTDPAISWEGHLCGAVVGGCWGVIQPGSSKEEAK